MDYIFEWVKTDENGLYTGVYEQTIFGENLAHACNYFEGFHGALDQSTRITSIKTAESK